MFFKPNELRCNTMRRNSIVTLLYLITAVFLFTQFTSNSAIAEGKYRLVPADETRIVLKGWPNQNQFKYLKGWHSDNWSMECEQSYNVNRPYKTTIQLCNYFPRFYYSATSGGIRDISELGYWNWTVWKGSKIKAGQDTSLKSNEPKIFRHVYFTQIGNECQFMIHAKEDGDDRYSHLKGRTKLRPVIVLMTCNAENIFERHNFRIDDANGKVVISYPGKQLIPITPTRTINDSAANSSSTSNSSNDVSPLEKLEKKCTELGFTKGTEKHGDCVMKLHK